MKVYVLYLWMKVPKVYVQLQSASSCFLLSSNMLKSGSWLRLEFVLLWFEFLFLFCPFVDVQLHAFFFGSVGSCQPSIKFRARLKLDCPWT